MDEATINDICSGIKLNKNVDPDSPTQQTILDGIKFTISKTQENCQLQRVFKATWKPENGEVLHAYLHNKVRPGIGKIGSIFVS
jgi:hypothetical protein